MGRALPCLVPAALVLCLASTSLAGDWPQFRGPSGNGTSATAQTPTEWSDSKNIVWKSELPGRGASSPVVWGDRVFLTAFTGYGQSAEDPGEKADLKLHTLCIDRRSGAPIWDRSIDASPATQDFGKRVADHGYATGTPVTDGKRVFAFFGVSGVVAYDWDGKDLDHRFTIDFNAEGLGRPHIMRFGAKSLYES